MLLSAETTAYVTVKTGGRRAGGAVSRAHPAADQDGLEQDGLELVRDRRVGRDPSDAGQPLERLRGQLAVPRTGGLVAEAMTLSGASQTDRATVSLSTHCQRKSGPTVVLWRFSRSLSL
jgi:hypothetical protein